MSILGAAPLASSSSIPRRLPLLFYKAAHYSHGRFFPPDRSSALHYSAPITLHSRICVSSRLSRSSGRDPGVGQFCAGASSALVEVSRKSFEEKDRSVFGIRAVAPVLSVIGGPVSADRGFGRVGDGDILRSSSSCLLRCDCQRRYATSVRGQKPAESAFVSAAGRTRMPPFESSNRISTRKRAAAFAEDGHIRVEAPLTDLEKEKFKEVVIEVPDKLLTLPTILTLARVAAVPALLAVFYSTEPWATPAGAAIFVLAAITDWLDGYLARKMGTSSAFGAFLDPVADKLMVAAALVLLCTKPLAIADLAAIPWLLPVPTIAIIGREITMSAVREWAAVQGGDLHKAVAVNSLGKIKTASQMVAVTLLLASGEGGLDSRFAGVVGVGLLYVAALLALWSLAMYMRGIRSSLFK